MIQSYGYTHDNLADPREILVRLTKITRPPIIKENQLKRWGIEGD